LVGALLVFLAGGLRELALGLVLKARMHNQVCLCSTSAVPMRAPRLFVMHVAGAGPS
jgi:hypothetical protein